MNELLEFVNTDIEREVIEAYIEANGSSDKAAKELGREGGNVRAVIRRVRARAAVRGHAPEHDMTKVAPEGFAVKGTSTLYDADGNAKIQWVKTKADEQRRYELMKEAIESLCKEIKPAKPVKKLTRCASKQLLTVYPFGDPHIGLHSWYKETGEDYDLKSAEELFSAAMMRAVQCAPDSKEAVIINVGDYFHADNMENRTRKSGNALDVDSRYSKILQVGLRILETCIAFALTKHDAVTVINANGNHDEHSSQWLQIALHALYRKEPRVHIKIDPCAYQYMQFGKNLIGVTHGDQSKPNDLESIMSADRPKAWGETRHRYWYTGHVHHDQVKEYRGCKFESFRTLAAKDAWHSAAGYRSDRDLKVLVLHADYGEVERYTVNITQFQ